MRRQTLALALQMMVVVASLGLFVAADDRWPTYTLQVASMTLILFFIMYERWSRRS